ncbi:transcription factor HES-5 [Esox lucius]|uniref:Transcription factor HES-5 n=1 Tax=Esox lucius TaxID=8010 RepID=A0A3P8Y1G0_ESOLU|nr:transcription factor HES-5 [Esox lucius]
MAPTYTRDSGNTMLSTKDKHKLRKPVVEKMRRDRINTCIEQLKTLLEREFHKQDPNTKLEKADILEMTVVFLKQQLHPQSPVPQRAHSEGYSFCWRETLHFLSSSSIEDITLQNLQKTSQHVSPSSPLSSRHQHQSQGPVKQAICGQKSVWRPW